jgi:hypothetical protein
MSVTNPKLFTRYYVITGLRVVFRDERGGGGGG